MNKTIKNLLSKIAKTNWVNPAIPMSNKMYIAIGSRHRIDGEALKSNQNYSTAVCQRVDMLAGVETNGDWVMEGDYHDRPTIAAVAREYRELNND